MYTEYKKSTSYYMFYETRYFNNISNSLCSMISYYYNASRNHNVIFPFEAWFYLCFYTFYTNHSLSLHQVKQT